MNDFKIEITEPDLNIDKNDNSIFYDIKEYIHSYILHNVIGKLNNQYTRNKTINELSGLLSKLFPDNKWWVICDETNNRPMIIDNHQFIVDLYLKDGFNDNTYHLNTQVVVL